ncbi:acyl-CoA thioesterase domain-containing protein [Ruicaihuangia caeni]|uniref:Thioesterase family protein n=1 Tax=Ruicaihuangia caeni TaxID=3042517 RepID=A0AAW6T5N4_9MICO|nr:acyl-CoA thioesterase domain-containing protein [Klugiella sp. YN-L-19]MDI2099140.1 thioesterase family protein [Klugiella sp. YN-L-19]
MYRKHRPVTVHERGAMESDLEFSADWTIGHVFGGAVVAAALRELQRRTVGDDWLPASIQANFLRPLSEGPAVLDHALVHRGRRSATSYSTVLQPRPCVTMLVSWSPKASFKIAESTGASAFAPQQEPSLASTGDLSAVVDWRSERDWSADIMPRSGGSPVNNTAEAAGPEGPLRSWIRPRTDEWVADDGTLDAAWFAIAADLIGPAVVPAASRPFRVATISLQLSLRGIAPNGWLEQRLTARVHGDRAVAILELRTPNGDAVATATQSAVLLPASADEAPVAITAFGWGRANPAALTEQ